MATRLVPTDDAALWNRLVEVGGGTAFHRFDWLRVCADRFGWQFRPLLVEQDGVTVGLVPVLIEPRRPPRSVRPPFPFTGPLVPPDALPDALRALRRWQVLHGVPRLRFEFPPDLHVEEQLAAAGCTWEPDATFLIQVGGMTEDEVWRAMSRRAQRAVKKALAAGVEVRTSQAGEVEELLPRLFDEAWGVRGLASPYPVSIAPEFERRASTDPTYHATSALIGGELVGVQVALLEGDVTYCWGGGALRAHRDEQPMTLLHWDLFRWARERGYRVVDMVGKVDDGVATFKRSLGGVETPYLLAASTVVPDPVVRAVRAISHRGSAKDAAPAVEEHAPA